MRFIKEINSTDDSQPPVSKPVPMRSNIQALPDDPFEVYRQVFHDRPKLLRRVPDDSREHLDIRLSLEGPLAREHLIEHGAQ